MRRSLTPTACEVRISNQPLRGTSPTQKVKQGWSFDQPCFFFVRNAVTADDLHFYLIDL